MNECVRNYYRFTSCSVMQAIHAATLHPAEAIGMSHCIGSLRIGNQADICVYSKFDAFGNGVIICLYVDDMLIFGTDLDQVNKTKSFLSSSFEMKDMGEAEVILGIRIKKETNGISITQSHYIEKILSKFNFKDCSLVRTPIDPSLKLVPNKGTVVS